MRRPSRNAVTCHTIVRAPPVANVQDAAMPRRVRAVFGIVFFVAAPLILVLWPSPAPAEHTRGCMDAVAPVGDLTMDFTNVFVAAGAFLVSIAFFVSLLFGRTKRADGGLPEARAVNGL
jgi:hypothetical protein